MPNKVVIESYGTSDTTKVFFDDVEVKDIVSISFNASVDDIITYIDINYAIGTIASVPDDIEELDAAALNAVINIKKEKSNE